MTNLSGSCSPGLDGGCGIDGTESDGGRGIDGTESGGGCGIDGTGSDGGCASGCPESDAGESGLLDDSRSGESGGGYAPVDCSELEGEYGPFDGPGSDKYSPESVGEYGHARPGSDSLAGECRSPSGNG